MNWLKGFNQRYMVVSNITYNFLDTSIYVSTFTFYILDSALSLDETAEEILDEDAVLGVSNKRIAMLYSYHI